MWKSHSCWFSYKKKPRGSILVYSKQVSFFLIYRPNWGLLKITMTHKHITCTLHSRWTIDWKKKSILYSKVNTCSSSQVPWFRELLLFCDTHWYWTSRISTNVSIAAKFTKLFCGSDSKQGLCNSCSLSIYLSLDETFHWQCCYKLD